MSGLHHPARPSPRRLKSRAKELHRALRAGEPEAVATLRKYHPEAIDPRSAKLADAQLVIARSHGFPSWARIALAGSLEERPPAKALIKPHELDENGADETWEVIRAAASGDVPRLRRLIAANPRLSRAEFWYTPAIHFAVREGHAEAVRLFLDAGADPEWNGLHQGSLIEMARDRGQTGIARELEEASVRRGRARAEATDHPIQDAARRGDIDEVRALLDEDPELVKRGGVSGATALHVAAGHNALEVAKLLLDRGAEPHARRGFGRGVSGGFWGDLEPIDVAIWHSRRRTPDPEMIELLRQSGASFDLTIAAGLGDLELVREMLDADPARIREARPSGRRPLSAAVDAGHEAIARLLLERGADPTWEEPTGPKGCSLHSAAGAGNLELVKLLLAHGADPNATVESSGNAVFAASTPEIRSLLEAHGGRAEDDPYDLAGIEDTEKLEGLADDPRAAHRIGAAFTMAAGSGRPDLLRRLLDAGFRVPSVFTGCQTYLLHDIEMLRTLLEHGMSPDQMNWQRQTLLHHVCGGPDSTGRAVERAALLLDAGADISARDDEYRSTPLAWAARAGAVEMVEFLLARGAPSQLPDDEPWATPLAWAERRGHAEIAAILRRNVRVSSGGADRRPG